MNYFEKTEQLIQRAIDERIFPCAAYAVGDKDRIYLKGVKGYRRVILGNEQPNGVFDGKIPPNAPLVTENTLFDMASLSKILATTPVALRLIEEGEMCLDDTIGRFISAPQDKRDITIRSLLTHSSGIHPHFQLYNMCRTPDEIVDTILQQPLFYPTGERVEYSCMGFIVLGEILQKITGMRLDALAEKYVFEPLNMSKTGYTPKENPKLWDLECVCEEYSPTQGKYIEGVVHDENARFAGGISGNAGVFSCIDDVCKFATMLARGGEYKGKRIITPPMFEKAIQNHTPNIPVEDRGLGFYLSRGVMAPCGDLFKVGSFGHLGFTGNSLFVDIGTGIFAILLTNRVHYTRANDKIFRFRRVFHNCAMADCMRLKHS